MNATVAAAQELIALGIPVLFAKPHAKEPLTAHGVKDATLEMAVVMRWLKRHPDANLAAATGAPGPSVLDVDDPAAAGDTLPRLRAIHPPTVATPRGPHLWFAGTEQATVSLGYGELRGRGSYVLVPPSIHPSGKQYVWTEPLGVLPPLPDILAGQRKTAGTGDFQAAELITHGERHDALKDAAVRFLRGGFTDVVTLEQMLRAFFEARCDPRPAPRKDEFRKLAMWAASSELAQRERETAQQEEEPKKGKRKTGLDRPPSANATLAEHRGYVRQAGGWDERIDIKAVLRHGTRDGDALEIALTNGQWVRFEAQDRITKRGHWARVVSSCTSGTANPANLTDWQQLQVFRSLCLLADIPPEASEQDTLTDIVRELLALCDPITDHDIADPAGRYRLIAYMRARGSWDPRDRDADKHPVVIIDTDGQRYLRATELQNHLNHRGLGISHLALPGRMQMVGATRVKLNGREPAEPDQERRRTNEGIFYRLPEEL